MLTTEKSLARQRTDRGIRNAAALYLLLVVTSVFGLVIPQTLTVRGDATATAHKILASETLFRLAVVTSLIATIAFIFLGRALYGLLKDVNKTQATLMVVLVYISVPISFVASVNDIAALRLIHGGPALSGLGTSQMNALAMFFLGLGSDTSSLNSIFFGLWLLPFGLLAIKSGFIPRIVGYLVIVAGCSYLVGALNFLLAPPFASTVSGFVTLGYFGELAAVIWLVIKAAQAQFRR